MTEAIFGNTQIFGGGGGGGLNRDVWVWVETTITITQRRIPRRSVAV